MAAQASLDLVEISPQAEPPVCKILDYGKFKFQEQKRTQEAKKKQQIITVKEITLRPGTEEHDYQVKLKKVRQFLERGDKVKVTVRFRGRELAHKEIGGQQLNRFIEDVCDIGHVDGTPNMLGRMMSMMMSPGADKEKLKAKLDREKEAAEE